MTWAKVQQFIDHHALPYKVQRFNMSIRGVLVDTFTGDAVEYTAKDAMIFLGGFAKCWNKVKTDGQTTPDATVEVAFKRS